MEKFQIVRVRKKYDKQISELRLPVWLSEAHKREIVEAVKSHTPIIINGRQGATGKTYLKNLLESQNVLVFEEWECSKITLDESIFEVKMNNL